MTAAWLLAFFVAGCVVGIVTGLLPGIHVNVTAAFLAAGAAGLGAVGVPPLAVGVFIVALTVTHTFFDIIPTVFLGIPGDESYALLPSQRLVLEGRGLEAVRHALRGSWGSLLAAFAAAAVLLVVQATTGTDLLGRAEHAAGPWLGWFLLALAIVLVASDPRPLWGLAVFATSGLFGLVVFATPLVAQDGAFSVLFPALAGLFGTSGLILALLTHDAALPQQRDAAEVPVMRGAVATGTIGGFVSGLLPGLGSANVATLFSLLRRGDGNDGRYLQTVAAVNVADHMLGIAALTLIGRPRSGTAQAMQAALTPSALEMLALCACMLASGLLSRLLMERGASRLAQWIPTIPYRPMTWAVLVFVTSVTAITTGGWGLLVLLAGTLLGMVAPLARTRRAQAMGMFLVPVILFYNEWKAPLASFLKLEKLHAAASEVGLAFALGALLISAGAAAAVFAWTWRRRPPRALLWSAAMLAAGGLALVAAPPYAMPPVTFEAQVVRVKDGDTITVRRGERDETIRLSDIDCPESKQAFGPQAQRRTEELTRGATVRVVVATTDKYGRTVATVYLPDGASLNRRLVLEGFAWRFDRYSQDAELLALQQRAKAEGRGLWTDPHPIPPWEFRAMSRHR